MPGRSTAGRASAILEALKSGKELRVKDLTTYCNEVRAEGYGVWAPAALSSTLSRLVAEGKIERVAYKKGNTNVLYRLKETNN